jgi:hypothetical protein
MEPGKLFACESRLAGDYFIGEAVMSRHMSRWFAQVFPGVLRLFPSNPGQPLPTPHDELVGLVKENIKLQPGFHIARTATGAAGMAEVVYPLGDLEMKALAHYVSRLR